MMLRWNPRRADWPARKAVLRLKPKRVKHPIVKFP